VDWSIIYEWDPLSYPLACDKFHPILIKEKWVFRIIKNTCFSYSKEDDYYLEIKDIKDYNLWDLYINWELLKKDFNFSNSTFTF